MSVHNRLRIRSVFRLSFALLKNSFTVWIALALVVHLVSYGVAVNGWEYFEHYLNRTLDVKVVNPANPIPGCRVTLNNAVTSCNWYEVTTLVVAFILMQVIVIQLISLALRDQGIELGQVISYLERNGLVFDFSFLVRAELAINLMRALGVMILQFLAVQILNLILLFTFVYVEFLYGYFAVVSILLLNYFFCRLWLSIPVIVVESKGVLDGFRVSWSMTSSCKLKIVIVYLLTLIVFFATFALVATLHYLSSEWFPEVARSQRAAEIAGLGIIVLLPLLGSMVGPIVYFLLSGEETELRAGSSRRSS